MLRREFAIAMGARITWWAAAAGALLIGHGFVLAVDLFSAGSRSVAADLLMAREFDPLLGIVRPTVGGLYVTVALLGSVVAARVTSIERERHTLLPLILQTGRPAALVLAKFLAALLACGLQLGVVVLLLTMWRVVGGHLAAAEVLVSLLGHALFIVVTAAVGTAAAMWGRSLAQATIITMAMVMASWAIDAADGFTALAWVAELSNLSVINQLAPFEKGTLVLGCALWFILVAAGALALAYLGTRFDVRHRSVMAALVALLTAAAALYVPHVRAGVDLTQDARASLPPAAALALAALPSPPTLDIYLNREDSRRRQLESDVLAKLVLARPDLVIRLPLDRATDDALEGAADDGYGRIVVHGAASTLETRSTSRRELTTLIFESYGLPLPDWSQPAYPGHPCVVDGTERTALLAWAYLGVPGLLVLGGWLVARPTRRKT